MTIDKTKLPNAVQLGFLDYDGNIESLFGKGDGKTGLQAFLAFCAQQGAAGGYVPGFDHSAHVGYRYKSVSAYRDPRFMACLPKNFTLVGDGSTETSAYTNWWQDPASFGNANLTQQGQNTWGFLAIDEGSTLQGHSFDGRCDGVNNGAETGVISNFVQAVTDSVSGVTLQDLFCTRNVGGLQESFTVTTGLQSRNWQIVQVRSRNNHGTGLSLNGDMEKEAANPGTGLTGGHNVAGCDASGNTWQGNTAFGCESTKIHDTTVSNNGLNTSATKRPGNGWNMEWTKNVALTNVTAKGNTFGGIGGYGDNVGLVVNTPNLASNNTLGWAGEIGFNPAEWWTATPQKLRGLLRDITINGGTITPVAGGFHISIDTTDAGTITYPSSGLVVPSAIFKGVSGLTDPSKVKVNTYNNRNGAPQINLQAS